MQQNKIEMEVAASVNCLGPVVIQVDPVRLQVFLNLVSRFVDHILT